MNKYIRQVINGALPQTPKGTVFALLRSVLNECPSDIQHPLASFFSRSKNEIFLWQRQERQYFAYCLFIILQKAVMIYCFDLFPEKSFPPHHKAHRGRQSAGMY